MTCKYVYQRPECVCLSLSVIAAQVCCPAHIRYASILPAVYDSSSSGTGVNQIWKT